MSHRERDRERRDREKERERDKKERKERDKEKEREKEKSKEREKVKGKENGQKRKTVEEKPPVDKEEDEKIQKRRKKLEEWKKVNASVVEKELSELKELIASRDKEKEEKDEPKELEPMQEEQSPPSPKQHQLKDALEEDDDEEPAPIIQQQQQQPSDEPDPLDLFMESVHKEIKEIDTKPSNTTPTASTETDKKVPVKSKKYEDESDEEIAEISSDEDGPPKASKKYQKKLLLYEKDQSKILWTPFQKDLYVEVPEIAKMADEEVAQYREELDGIKIRGKNCPKPIKKFSQCGLTSAILAAMEKHNYQTPTPIQAQAIPAVMCGRDVIGIAKTGSGKTLAFLLPMLRQIVNQPPITSGDGPIGLVLAPTRELALQIFSEVKKFTKALSIRAVCCYGGAAVAEQIAELKRGAEVVVATPGRMIDLLCANSGRVTNLLRVTMLVLDEADRMFDMGFEPQIMAIVNNVRPDRQLLMFSATFPVKVEGAAKQIMQKPLEIVTGGRNVVCADVDQHVDVIESDQKWGRLLQLLEEYYGKGSILVFVDTQGMADSLYTKLIKAGYDSLSLHGGMNQQDRTSTIQDYKNKIKSLMVATSVAARGLDVKELNLVINYEVPNHIEDYVHRVGRTGRAGQKGVAYTFIEPEEEEHAPGLLKALEQAGAEIPKALQDLVDSYNRKKEEGKEVRTERSGYIGKGFAFNESEVQEKKKLQRLSQGIVETEEEEEEAKELENKLEEKNNKINEKFAQKSGGKMSAMQRALNIAAKITSSKVEQGMEEGTYAEIEINDYPQMSRWKVTNREATARIQEWTGTSIVCKGVFVPIGKNPPPGERRLYILIEGPTKQAVDNAKSEVKGILAEAASDPTASIRDQARYSIFP